MDNNFISFCSENHYFLRIRESDGRYLQFVFYMFRIWYEEQMAISTSFVQTKNDLLITMNFDNICMEFVINTKG